MANLSNLGVVIIGRNEGQRLIHSIQSVVDQVERVVYVDSDSSDDSVAQAKVLGCSVVELDLSIPFTAGRARNEGFEALLSQCPEITYVQFIDGDCRVDANWLAKAQDFLAQSDEFVLVCGQRHEINPQDSVYNQLCDIEWNTPIGEARASGGDFMIKVKAFKAVDGFTLGVIAGEEPEMCFRIRQLGHKIYRIDAPMTYHDANMTRLSQWWNRSVRCGHAYAEGAYRHGKSPERYDVRETRSALMWSSLFPLSLLASSLFPPAALLLLLYPVQVLRLWIKNRHLPKAFFYALFLVLGKFPESIGVLKFHWRRLTGSDHTIIEYK